MTCANIIPHLNNACYIFVAYFDKPLSVRFPPRRLAVVVLLSALDESGISLVRSDYPSQRNSSFAHLVCVFSSLFHFSIFFFVNYTSQTFCFLSFFLFFCFLFSSRLLLLSAIVVWFFRFCSHIRFSSFASVPILLPLVLS